MPEAADITFAGQSITEALAAEDATFKILSIDGDGLLAEDVQTHEQPGGHGDRWVDTTLPERTLEIEYSVQVDSVISHEALVRRGGADAVLSRVLHSGREPKRITLSHLDGYFMGRLSAHTPATRLAHFVTGTLSFTCPSPWRYTDEEHTVSPDSDGELEIETNHFVAPVITWETSSDVGAAWIGVDGHRLTIDTGISEGQQIRIDCERKETRIGGVLNVTDVYGSYPRVRDGSVVESNPGGDMSFEYQERWV